MDMGVEVGEEDGGLDLEERRKMYKRMDSGFVEEEDDGAATDIGSCRQREINSSDTHMW